jgi:ligand-binding sensor domain-containing protein
MRIKLILFIFSFLFLCSQPKAQFNPEFFDNYTVVPDQPSLPAMGIFKDSQGFIWGLYIGGLYRFDGISMKHFTRIPGDTNSLSDNLNRTILFEDSLNRLWISNFSNDIDILDKHTEKITHIKLDKTEIKNKQFGGLMGGCLDAQGNVLGYALGGYLVKYYLTKNTVETILVSPEHADSSINKVNMIFKDRDNVIWIGTSSGLVLYHAEDNSFSRPVLPELGSDLLNNSYIIDMMQDIHGTYWISNGNGLFKYDHTAFTITHFNHKENDPESISHDIIQHIHEYPPDSGKTLLLHTLNGLNFFDKKSGKARSYLFDRDDPANTHIQVYYDEIVDETGRLWVCSDNFKMIVFTPREDVFKNVQIIDELQNHYIGASFCKDEEGNLWVGTAYGGLFKFDNNLNIIDRFQFNPEDSWRNNFFFFSLFLDGETLWLGLASRGLGKLNIKTREFELVLSTAGVRWSPVYRIYEITRDRFGVLWFCSASGIFYLDTNAPDAEVKKIRKVEGLDPFAMSVYEDNDGNLWFPAPGRGMYYLSLKNRADTSFILFNHDENDPESPITDQISTICQDNEGNYWIGSGVGLLRYHPEDSSFSSFEYHNNSERTTVSNLKLDNDGNLWFMADRGIMKFSPGTSEKNTFRPLTSHDGMPFSNFYPWEFHMDQDGIIYCGGVRGSGNSFFYFDPKDLPENKYIPPIVLTSFKVRNEDFEMDSRRPRLNIVYEVTDTPGPPVSRPNPFVGWHRNHLR